MGDQTKIEWADATLNFWIGCTQLKRAGGSACDNCYAKQMAVRLKIKWNAPPVKSGPAAFERIASYQRGAARFEKKHGRPRRVFVNSMSDFFDNQADPDWRHAACYMMERAPDVIFMLLTKRPENVVKMVPKRWLEPGGWPKNVWLGVTVEAQDTADHRIPLLLAVPGVAVRFLSMEPLLEGVDLTKISTMRWRGAEILNVLTGELEGMFGDICATRLKPINWVIIGGESGRKARPTAVRWVRAIVEACEAASVPVLLKQWGEWVPAGQYRTGDVRTDGNYPVHRFQPGPPTAPSFRVGKKAAGRRLDGTEYNEFPEAAAA